MKSSKKLFLSFTFCISCFSSFSQGKIMKTFYDEQEKKLREEYTLDLGDSGWEKNGVYKSFYPSGRLALEGFYKENKKNDWFREYYDTLVAGKKRIKSQVFYENNVKNGQMLAFGLKGDTLQKATFKNDELIGSLLIYHPNGKLHRSGNFANGNLEGIVKEYYSSGQLYKEAFFKEGQPEGIIKTYYESGNLMSEETYAKGVQAGLTKEYYDAPSLPIKTIYTMKNNAKEGKEEIFSEKGILIKEVYYVNGMLNGTAKQWDKNTKELIYEATYDKGYRINTETEYYLNKKIAKITTYSNQERNRNVINYTETGEVIYQANFINNQLEGLVKSIPKGREVYWDETNYKNGKKEGESKTFYLPKKNIRSIEFYKQGVLNGKSETYYENGKIKAKGNYKEGNRVGNWYFYDENGKEEIKKF
jgi:antitoxin component YwqK of YwqJK toxin-antitoxin module